MTSGEVVIEQQFSGPNLDNNVELADRTHPQDILEPLPQNQMSRDAEMLGLVLAEVFRTKLGSKMKYPAAFNRFVALTWVLRPDLVGGRSLTDLAEEIGVSRAALSKLAVKWSDMLGGFRNGAQKSAEARKSYRKVQQGHENFRGRGGGPDRRTAERLEQLREDFLAGVNWAGRDKELLRRKGFIGQGDRLTDAGRAWIEGCPPGGRV